MFCGADLAAHAIRLLGLTDISSTMTLHRALDITPIYCNYFGGKRYPNINAARMKSRPPAVDVSPMSLLEMASKVLCKDWLGKSNLRGSNWSKDALFIEQIKYAVMDAWVSAELGIYLWSVTPDVLDNAFSTCNLEYTYVFYKLFQQTKDNAFSTCNLEYTYVFYKLFQQTKDNEDLQEEEVLASVSNIQPIVSRMLVFW